MAFECIEEKNYHINSDFTHLEFLDEGGNNVSYNKPGNVIVTRLYGLDTPIIRYSGLEDIAIPVESENICDIRSPMIKKIEGRKTDLIIFSNGETISPLTITGIPAKIMEEYNSFIIKQFQIIQNKKTELEINVEFDKMRGISRQKINEIIHELSNRINKQLNNQIESRLNDEGYFFIRLNKQLLLDNTYVLTDKGNCFHIKIKIAGYPAKRSTFLESIKILLSNNEKI